MIERSHRVVLRDDRWFALVLSDGPFIFAGKNHLLFEFNGELAEDK